MTREPKIPMLPSELPQQRMHEAVGLLPRPEPFDCKAGYWDYPSGSAPKNQPRNPTYLCQVEWAWSPLHNRLDAYYLHRGRSHWSLWLRSVAIRLPDLGHPRCRRMSPYGYNLPSEPQPRHVCNGPRFGHSRLDI